tara:strand:+ start:199 stop:345 length:147 start_codon:yes stop_codon:yes gene_type:complete
MIKMLLQKKKIKFNNKGGGFTIMLGEKPKPPSTENQTTLKDWLNKKGE